MTPRHTKKENDDGHALVHYSPLTSNGAELQLSPICLTPKVWGGTLIILLFFCEPCVNNYMNENLFIHVAMIQSETKCTPVCMSCVISVKYGMYIPYLDICWLCPFT